MDRDHSHVYTPHELIESIQRLVYIGSRVLVDVMEVQTLTNLAELCDGFGGKMEKGVAVEFGPLAHGDETRGSLFVVLLLKRHFESRDLKSWVYSANEHSDY